MPNIPLHLQHRMGLRKALSGGSAEEDLTDYKQTEVVVSTDHIAADYRVPVGRAYGNQLFRRNHDGSLDVDSARDSVLTVLSKVRHKAYLTDFEKLILSSVFPGVFQFYDPMVASKMASVQLQISMQERQDIAILVSAHMAEELNWNGGFGGGSVAGRSFTVQ
jgi:hypothetical protein